MNLYRDKAQPLNSFWERMNGSVHLYKFFRLVEENLFCKGKKKSPVDYKQTTIIKGDDFKGTFNVSNSVLPNPSHHALCRCRPQCVPGRLKIRSYLSLAILSLHGVKPGKI